MLKQAIVLHNLEDSRQGKIIWSFWVENNFSRQAQTIALLYYAAIFLSSVDSHGLQESIVHHDGGTELQPDLNFNIFKLVESHMVFSSHGSF